MLFVQTAEVAGRDRTVDVIGFEQAEWHENIH